MFSSYSFEVSVAYGTYCPFAGHYTFNLRDLAKAKRALTNFFWVGSMVQDEGLANTKTSQQCAVVLQVANLSCQDEIGQLCPMTGPFGHLPMSEAVDGTSRWFGKATFGLLGLPLWEKLLWVTAWYCHSKFTIFATWVCLKVVRVPDFSGKVPYITVHHTAYTVYFSTQRYFLTDQSRSLVIIRLIIRLSGVGPMKRIGFSMIVWWQKRISILVHLWYGWM